MKIGKETQAQARRLIRLCLDEHGLLQEDTVRQIASAIAERRPRGYMALLSAFTELVRLQKQKHSAVITSAVPLTPDEQQAIRSKLDARHEGLDYSWKVDPALIAGFTVRVADDFTDASVRSRIEQLSRI
ncbi:MAG TPA: ATP synthase F1 subunit delta [Candidatus Akkermansia intestinigallinarum]|uniref:ATP synthase F1 subunit delta n=1 Tax=Candidatus Akkermansia intestinigallinarum TaxID=2838431 RepID=A0A9D1VCT7_9BACT|nr:ATP synthase F1 subunit delta [Candidatus Akkermansia intestinigallinarum]